MIFEEGSRYLESVVQDVAIDSDRSRSGIIGQMQEGLGGLILCYAQVLSVGEVGSLVIEGSSVRRSHVSVNPACRASKWAKS